MGRGESTEDLTIHHSPLTIYRVPIRYLSRLRLSAFRNYASAELDLDGRHLVLTGPNGAGKTNLLEAVSLLSPGHGLRRAAEMEEVAKTLADLGTGAAMTRGTIERQHAIGRLGIIPPATLAAKIDAILGHRKDQAA